MTDIVVPFVNCNDSIWKKEIDYYSKMYKKSYNPARYRDNGLFKYVLRSIWYNCPFIDNVILILSYESQIQKWLNVDNKKLKIVYHKDYIPNEFLPTFNSSTIELFIPFINCLSENFIYINDDMLFTKLNTIEDFFINGLPVDYVSKIDIDLKTKNMYRKMLINNYNFHNREVNYRNFHCGVSYNKSKLLNLLEENLDIIKNSITTFRSTKNLTHLIYRTDYLKKGLYYQNENIKNERKYYNLSKINSYNFYDYKSICLNDCLKFDGNMDKVLNELDKLFPNKCDFEI